MAGAEVPKAAAHLVRMYIIAGLCGLAMLVALCLAGVALIVRFNSTNLKVERQKAINTAVCSAVVHLDAAITQSLRRSLTDLPKIAYYKAHPTELATQQREVRRSLKTFLPPKACGPVNLGGSK